MRLLICVPLVAVLGIGCLGHVQLPAPPSEDDREAFAAYRTQMRPTGRSVRRTTTVTVDGDGTELRRMSSTRERLVLQRGDVILYPDDLVVVLGEDTECGRVARDAGAARTMTDAWGIGGGVLLTTSLVTLLATPEARLGLPTLPNNVSPTAVVLGGAAVGSFVMLAVSNGDTNTRRVAAFSCYEAAFGYIATAKRRS